MRVCLAGVVTATLFACNETPVNPSPITRIPGLAGPLARPVDRTPDVRDPAPKPPTPEPAAPPTPPPPPVVAAPPTAAQLGGAFDLHYNCAKGDPLVEDDVRIIGDSKGAVLTQVVTGKTEKVDIYKVDPAAVSKLLKALDAHKWWTLDDARAAGKDLTLSTLEIQRGGFTRQFRTQGPAPGAQTEAIKLVSKLASTLGPKAKEKLTAPSTEAFKPGKVAATPGKEKWDCEPAPGGLIKCDTARCFPQGKVFACFHSPFKTDKGVAIRQIKLAPSKGPAPKLPNYFWAFELKDGRRCEGPPVPIEPARWTCKGGKEPEEVERLVHSGEGLLAAVGGSRKLVPITRVWK